MRRNTIDLGPCCRNYFVRLSLRQHQRSNNVSSVRFIEAFVRLHSDLNLVREEHRYVGLIWTEDWTSKFNQLLQIYSATFRTGRAKYTSVFDRAIQFCTWVDLQSYWQDDWSLTGNEINDATSWLPSEGGTDCRGICPLLRAFLVLLLLLIRGQDINVGTGEGSWNGRWKAFSAHSPVAYW